MTTPTLACHDERRRDAVRAARHLNGLDYLELLPLDPDQPAGPAALLLSFLDKAPQLLPGNLRIDGGRRVRDLQVLRVETYRLADPERDDLVLALVDRRGDFSTYTLRLVEQDALGRPTERRLAGIDPRYDRLAFSFAASCPSDLDCAAEPPCPPPDRPEPAISYLAKDYASFRRLILDRLALVMPGWQERHIPDVGIALVELLAYVGDQLSYYQDAVATEAYLDTARRRISVRRHARLVDYALHEGCNARAWLTVAVSQDLTLAARDVAFVTGYPGAPADGRPLTADELRDVPAHTYEVFEPLLDRAPDRLLPADLRDPHAIAGRIHAGHDPLARYLRGLLSPTTLALIESAEPADLNRLIPALLADLNQVLLVHELFEAERFAALGLGVELEVILAVRLDLRALRRLNRLLLEAVFPAAIRDQQTLYLYADHNLLPFYTWGDQACCLPRGATSATLRDGWLLVYPDAPAAQPGKPAQASQARQQPPAVPQPTVTRRLRRLRPGDVLIFEELIGPATGSPADADPRRRHAVRLTRVEPAVDELYRITSLPGRDPQTGAPAEVEVDLGLPVVEIAWAEEDALPFPLCLSTVGPAPQCALITDVSVARGNVLLVDHGQTIAPDEDLGAVPVAETAVACVGADRLAETTVLAGPFAPRLRHGPLSFAQPVAPGAPASGLLAQDPRLALPQLALFTPIDQPGRGSDIEPLPAQVGELVAYRQRWSPRRDLLGSRPGDPHLVVEVDDRGHALIRFGDGEHGMRPEAGARFHARYRVGNGPAGNVGADAITHLLLRGAADRGAQAWPRNPLPAQGGRPAEPLDEARLFAPDQFRAEIQRAITADDYAAIAMREFPAALQRAAATLRWTGSRYEALVVVDPRGGVERDPALLDQVRKRLERYRRMGHGLTVAQARYVPLEIRLHVCVKPHYAAGQVKAALLARLSSRALPDGRRGFFHPDNLTFGAGVYLSAIVAEAMAVTGVENVQVLRFQRRFVVPGDEIAEGIIRLGPLEVARLDNDPSFPENGVLILDMEGGR